MSFEEELNKRFEEQSKAIEEMEAEGPEVFGHYLKDQQRLTVLELNNRGFFLNYSETGAGKTKAAISSAFYLGLKHVIVFCPFSVVDTWKKQINEANFVKSENVVENTLLNTFNDDDFTFEIFNYDKFNNDLKATRRIKKIVNSKRYDLVVFDEVHRLKNKESNTYQSILKFVQILRGLNPNLKILGATATPITTSNKDLQGIYEMLSGKVADELTMGNLANRLINANKILETSGFGYFPKSKLTVRYNGIDSDELFAPGKNGNDIFHTDLANIDGTSIEQECIKSRGNASKIEDLHMFLKFDSYKGLIKKGTVIYTEYTYGDKMLMALKDLVEDNLGLSVAIYSGEIKGSDSDFIAAPGEDKKRTSLDDFIEGKKDVLIGTKSMCEGVDGIQWVSNRVILHTIPSVWSVMHQLIGRFDRQGSNFIEEGVDVFVPMVVFHLPDGKTTSFDKRRWKISMFRKLKDDVTKGGHLKEITFAEKEKLIDEVISKLKGKYEMTEIERDTIDLSELDFEVASPEWHRKESVLNDFNRMGKHMNSRRFHERMVDDPEQWREYHRIRHERMQTWGEIPYEYIASKIKNKNRVVADFGCGENLMKKCIPDNKVYSFDHVAIDETVIACDMSHTPLDNESIDIAVFSLALWGTNYEDYFKEAYRLLNYDGLMYIAEPSKSYDETERAELLNMLKKNGFTQVGNIEDRGKFFYVTVIKK
jgi:superfamily II DNA or RNA helicase